MKGSQRLLWPQLFGNDGGSAGKKMDREKNRSRRNRPSAFQTRQRVSVDESWEPISRGVVVPVTSSRHLNRMREILSQYESPVRHEVSLEFYPYTNLKHTIRRREGAYHLRFSDILRDAPAPVLDGLTHILLAKIHGHACDPRHEASYNRFARSEVVHHRIREIQRERARRVDFNPVGRVYNLDESFDRMNRRYFRGKLSRPRVTWTRLRGRTRLGTYDDTLNVISINRRLDSVRVPRFVLDYIMFHEMLHMVFPIEIRNGRRVVHSRDFKEAEKTYSRYEQANRWLRRF